MLYSPSRASNAANLRRAARLLSNRAIRFLLLCAALAGAEAAADDAPADKGPVDFNKQVAPIFTKYCTGCHDALTDSGELNLASHQSLMKGGAGGAVIVPGQPDKSRLILSLEKKIEPFMPPEGEKAPTPAEIAILKAWIKAGAKPPANSAPAPLDTPDIPVAGPFRRPIQDVAFAPDGQSLAIARHGRIELLTSADRRPLAEIKGLTGQVNDVGFSRDGKLLFAAAGEPGLFGEASVWDAVTYKRLQLMRGHADSLYAAAMNADATILATGGYDHAIKLWDVKSGKEIRTLDGHNGAVFDLAFHPSGKFLASASGDFTIKLWNVATGERLDTRNEPTKGQNTVAFSPDGRWLAAGGIDNRIRVWRMDNSGRAHIVHSRFAHDAAILKIAFSPDGRQLVSSAEDRTVKVWETVEFTQIAVLETQPDWAAALDVSPDNRTLLAGRLDGTLAAYALDELEQQNETAEPISDVRVASAIGPEMPQPKPTAEAEPNNQPAQATKLTVPVQADGVLLSSDGEPDADLYRFQAKRGEVWMVETRAARDKSPADTRIEILHADGRPVGRLLLRAVRDSAITFRPINSTQNSIRVTNWEEMQLNQYLYMNGEVCKLFRMPQGPDSGFVFYSIGGKRRCYFGSSATVHANEEPVYIVEAYRPGTELADNGLPVFTLNYANDDDGERKLGNDSRLKFTAPADGEFLVRVTDVRGAGGKDYKYRLTVRPPQPDFNVTIDGKGATVGVGSGQRLTFKVDRADDFNGPVRIDISGLPEGWMSPSPIVIQAGHLEARGVLHAAPTLTVPAKEGKQKEGNKAALPDWSQVQVMATATIGGRPVTKGIGDLGTVKLAARPKVVVHLSIDDPSVSPAEGELVIAPGSTITALITLERNGYDGDLKFDVDNLPHGVIVDNIGLSGILIRAGETRRQIFLTAADWVPETTRTFHAVAKGQGNQASRPLTLHVRRDGAVAAK